MAIEMEKKEKEKKAHYNWRDLILEVEKIIELLTVRSLTPSYYNYA